MARRLLWRQVGNDMKVTADLNESLEATDPTDDMGILIKLSVLHGAFHNLASDRNGILPLLPERRKPIEQIAAQVDDRRRALARPTVEIESPAAVESAPPQLQAAAIVPPKAEAEGTLLILETQAEGRTATASGECTSLEARASRLAAGLSPSAFRIYRSLADAKKWPFTIVLNGDSCSGCNMRLPSALVSEFRRTSTLHRCPSCKRVLAAAETTVSS